MGRDEHDFSLFRMKTTKTHLAGQFSFQIDFGIRKKYPKIIIFIHFPRNTIKTPSVLTLAGTLRDTKSVMLAHFPRNTIKTRSRLHKISSKSALHGFLGPEVVPDEPRPGRRASLAGWPCLAARWAALAGLAGDLPGRERAPTATMPPPPLLSPQAGYSVCCNPASPPNL